MRFKRYCRKCNIQFRPFGKFTKVCDNCKKEFWRVKNFKILICPQCGRNKSRISKKCRLCYNRERWNNHASFNH